MTLPDGALPDADENIGEDSLLVIKPGTRENGSEDRQGRSGENFLPCW